MSRARSPRGAATVLVSGFLGLLCLVAAALGVVAAMVADHRRAQAAADLAALAGAGSLSRGGAACPAAEGVATDNGASLTGCRTEGREVWVTVSVPGPRWLGQAADLTAEARAGPG